MFFFLSKILDVALDPLTLALVALVLGAALARRWPRAAWALGAAGVAVLAVAACPWVSGKLGRWAEAGVESTERPDVVYDGLVFLGGAVDYGGYLEGREVPYGDNVERVHATFDYLRRGRARFGVLSGTGPTGLPSEAGLVAQQLVGWGISREQLLLDETSVNTRENARNVAALAKEHGLKSLLLVTSAAHMPRARECFWAAGLQVDVLPVDRRGAQQGPIALWPRATSLANTARVLRELFGRFFYRAVGYSRAEPPAPAAT